MSDATDIGPTPARPAPSADATVAVPTAVAAAAASPTVAIPVDPGPDATWVMPPDTAAAGAAAAAATQATPVVAAPQPPYIPPPPTPAPELSKKGRRRRRRWPWVVLILFLLAGGAGGGSYLVVSSLVPSHPLPDVLNRPEQDATAQLLALKFKVVVRQEFMDGTAAGLVSTQTPPGGADVKLKEGRTVTLVVSKGPTPTLVPDLTGMNQAQAKQAIEAVGHTLGTVTSRNDETVDEGSVLDWTLKGQSPPKGAAVDVVLSAGPAPRTVPNLSGKSYEEAAAALSDLGLEVSRVDSYTDDDDLKGQVVGTDPAAGAKVGRGGKVTITVSKGRPVVPKLNGLNVEKATAALEAVGLKVGSKFGPGGGNVFLAVPGEGSNVKPGSSVTLYIL
jgi:serine/threonine-protein kinase